MKKQLRNCRRKISRDDAESQELEWAQAQVRLQGVTHPGKALRELWGVKEGQEAGNYSPLTSLWVTQVCLSQEGLLQAAHFTQNKLPNQKAGLDLKRDKERGGDEDKQ